MNKNLKGIVLAGGKGTRFRPLTTAVNKHLLPLYDKPMVFAPISMLMLMGIREILVVTNPQDVEPFKSLLGTGERFGTKIEFAIQEEPTGLPDALLEGEHFLNGDPCAMILGDNIFHGRDLGLLLQSYNQNSGATIFTYEVDDPTEYGVATYDPSGCIIGLVEKPQNPDSNWAVAGLYVLDSRAVEFCKGLKSSSRGETEMVDLLNKYLAEGTLESVKLPRGITWLDMGTPENLLQASEYLRLIDMRQRLKVAILEEIAWRSGWISLAELRSAAKYFKNSQYGDYLADLCNDA